MDKPKTVPEVQCPQWAMYGRSERLPFKMLLGLLRSERHKPGAFKRIEAYHRAEHLLEQHQAKTGREEYTIAEAHQFLIQAAQQLGWYPEEKKPRKPRKQKMKEPTSKSRWLPREGRDPWDD